MYHSVSTQRLLAIHAHPDDESSKGAATTAKYAAEGAEVLVVTCTGGERGDIINPAMDRPGVLENMGSIRREEMAKAAAALGVKHRWLGHVDSGLPGNPLAPNIKDLLPEGCFALKEDDDVAQELVEIIREFRPRSSLRTTKTAATRTQTTSWSTARPCWRGNTPGTLRTTRNWENRGSCRSSTTRTVSCTRG